MDNTPPPNNGPVPPNKVTARQGQTANRPGGILVEWTTINVNQDSFQVYRADPGGELSGPINPPHQIQHSFWDKNVEHGKKYLYNVKTIFNGRISDFSAVHGECIAP